MNMQEFLTKLSVDQALAGKLSKATDPENAYAIAKEAGLNESFDTFAATMKKMNEAAGEMNAAEIDTITGGANISDEVISVVSAGASLSVSSVVVYYAAAV